MCIVSTFRNIRNTAYKKHEIGNNSESAHTAMERVVVGVKIKMYRATIKCMPASPIAITMDRRCTIGEHVAIKSTKKTPGGLNVR